LRRDEYTPSLALALCGALLTGVVEAGLAQYSLEPACTSSCKNAWLPR